jgi:signal transduction histidine kinase
VAETSPTTGRKVRGVERLRDPERLGALTGLIASLAVGVPVLLDTVAAGGALLVGPPWVWWSCYLGYLLALGLLIQAAPPARPRWLTGRLLLGAQVTLGAAAYVLSPQVGWTVVLLIVTAGTAAYDPARVTAATVVVSQTVLVGLVTWSSGMEPLEAALSVVVYGSFQWFAVLVVWSAQGEAEAREHLAAANEELHRTTAMLQASSRTAERLRIARDLHDLVGHQLTALALELEVASHLPGGDGLHVQRARSITKQLLGDVREAVGELRAPKRELRDALVAVTSGLPRPHIELRVDDDVVVDDDTSLALLRCVQEVVTNTLRHAGAGSLKVEVTRRRDGGVRLATRDDGRGAARLERGNGLSGIAERIEALGGTVEVRAEAGRGMQLVADVPPR